MTAGMFVPPKVRELADEILQHTGQPPIVECRDPRRYVVILDSDRVRLTVTFKLAGQRWLWHASTLDVDGQRRPNMHSHDAFYRLFRDPDSGVQRAGGTPGPGPVPRQRAAGGDTRRGGVFSAGDAGPVRTEPEVC